ncbi:lipopolysaccharide biosynthesis protein [Faecalicoccus acidiformans]|uniref:Polysaccharide biosynthesis protein n=1 Tax=Faecalicoccus acidiformans TaxID=915173 RepID=A0ABS2FPT9_9FIRM|nr:hypothetical protein [Faecalicoccus acidiformans]MBM6831321.1 hypothetical protein [Faecalicoccus acidiformans]
MKEKIIHSLLDVSRDKILKRSFFWNMIASMLNAVTSAILLFFITRFCGINEAGVFSIASAIAYQCVSLGNFGTRGVQASDVKEEFSFSDYFYVRVFSYSLLMAMLLYYAFGSGYTIDKSLAVLSFGLFKSIDVIEDLYHGEYHRHQRLDIASLLLVARYSISILVFIILIVFSSNIFVSSFVSFLISLFIFIFSNKNIIKVFYSKKYTFCLSHFKKLLFIVVPVAITTFIRMYMTNAPKYAIDNCLGDVDQAYFNVLFMPVFIITLISDIIFRPYIPKFSSDWYNFQLKSFTKMLYRQLFIILLLTIIITLGGYLLGLRLLELIYGIELHRYMVPFLLLLIGGGINTYSAYMTIVITVIRAQKNMALVHVLDFAICLLIMNPLVESFSINGAVFIFIVLNLVSSVLSTGIFVKEYVNHKKELKVNGN